MEQEQRDRDEAIERLVEIKDEMRDLVNEAMQLIRDQVGYDDVRYARAERYWSGHITGALGTREDSFSQRSMFTLQETIDELDESGCGNCGGELDDPDYELCSDCR